MVCNESKGDVCRIRNTRMCFSWPPDFVFYTRTTTEPHSYGWYMWPCIISRLITTSYLLRKWRLAHLPAPNEFKTLYYSQWRSGLFFLLFRKPRTVGIHLVLELVKFRYEGLHEFKFCNFSLLLPEDLTFVEENLIWTLLFWRVFSFPDVYAYAMLITMLTIPSFCTEWWCNSAFNYRFVLVGLLYTQLQTIPTSLC